MKSSRVLTGALIAGSVAVASMFAAAPASAATLPAGAKITVIDLFGNQFYNVSPATAVGTAVGTPVVLPQVVSSVDVDDAGLGYATATEYQLDDPPIDREAADDEVVASLVPDGFNPVSGWIYKADANTGKLTDGKQVSIVLPGDDVLAKECSAIDYSKGTILAVCYSGGAVEYGAMFVGTVDFAVNPAYATLTPLVTVPAEEGFIHFEAIAMNPVDGILYGFADNYNDPTAYTITLDNAYPEEFSELDAHLVWGADFDRGGQLWLTVSDRPQVGGRAENVSEVMSLATFDFATDQPVIVDLFSSADPYSIEQPEAITVWGVLAATGSTMSIAPAVAASGILLLGAMLAAGTMVLRRRSAEV